MNLRLNILIILFSFLNSFLLSNLLAQQLPLKKYTVASGLVSNYIFDLMQDKDGFIWIATDRGVSRFDGKTFQNFTKADGLGANFTYKIFQSSDSTIWFGSYQGGVTQYKNGIFKKITKKDALISNTINDITEDDFGRIYLSTDEGISIYKDSVLFSFKATVSNTCGIFKHPTGKIFFSKDSLIFVITPQKEDIFHSKKISLSKTQKEILFMRSWASPLFNKNTLIFPGRNKYLEIKLTDNADIISVNSKNGEYYALLKDRLNRIWYAERNKITVSQKENNWIISEHNGLDPKYVEALLEDYEGNIWLGSFGGGLYKYKGDYIRYFTERNGLPTNLTTKIFEDTNGNILIGTTNGLAILKENKIETVPLMLKTKEIQAINQNSKGEIFIGTFDYVIGPISNLDNIINAKIQKEYYGTGVSSIYVDKSDNLWIGTYGKGLVHQINSNRKYYTKQNGLASDIVENVIPGNNSLWLLSKNVGATNFSQDSITFFQKENGLISDAIYSLFEEIKGTVWFGTDQGVTKLSNKKFQTFHKNKGLIGNYVIDIFNYKGVILFVTEKAIHFIENNKFEIFIGSDILLNNEIEIKNVFYSKKNGILWLATNNGIVKINLDKANSKKKWLKDKYPKCIITTVYSDTTELFNWNRDDINNKLILNPNQNNITFSFNGISFIGEVNPKYCYKLEGVDKEWSESIIESEVIYRNLASGNYKFHVKTVNSIGVASDISTQIKLEILPPFWMELWFIIPTSVILLSIITWIIYFISTRKLRENIKILEQEKAIQEVRQETREQIAGELHDDVSSTLSSINLYADSLKQRLKKEPDNIEQYLSKLNDLTREAQVTMEEVVWALSPHHDTMQDLISRISDFTSELCCDNNITCSIKTLDIKNDFKVDEFIRKNIYLILKEALNNILKHSKANNVNITIGVEKNIFIFDISDNGCGFSKENRIVKSKGGNGLSNMQKRAEKIDAQFSIKSEINKGTNIILKKEITHMSY